MFACRRCMLRSAWWPNLGPTSAMALYFRSCKHALACNSYVYLQEVYAEKRLVAKLRPHQRDGVHFMFSCLAGLKPGGYTGSILMDGMGLGVWAWMAYTVQ
jgi:hypothetical protein